MSKPVPRSPLYLWEGGWCMLAPHLHNRPHRHVAASLLVGLAAPIQVQLAGHGVTAEAVWAAPDVEQALSSDGPVAVLHLDPDHRAWRALRLQGPGGEFPLAAHPDFAAALRALAAAPSVPGALALRDALQAGEPRPLDPRVRTACLSLRRGDGEVGGAELAVAVGLSESRFRHLFRQELGVNLKRFQLHLKCQRALTLWRDGMSLTDLALAAGFYDQPHLNRTLRAMFDTLPSRYARAFPVRVEHLDPA
ncbi:helix-turn-helix domain-containing protein [Alloalcanivorax marinus]|uniref:helix-turn-helix domain-containing protein n=2 Tax=Alloalcanivorax marinus TaxID=1177169 RepID=UPI001EF80ABA|nr:AraC family transcriptional regulator [Alloalcanivorax marinus]MCH2555780.1 AraC family transcriptional regulator [Alcanivorax sp.]